MDFAHLLPHITATLNGLAALLLIAAWAFMRSGNRAAHRTTMLVAVVVSGLFLAFYLIYHFTAPIFVFPGQGAVRSLYYTLLISHVVLALMVVPMIVFTLRRGLTSARQDFEPETIARHRALARWTFPIWLYVSLSGLTVYVMLYHIYS